MPIPSHLTLDIPVTDQPRIVIIGGGFAGLRLAKALKGARAQVVMLDRNNFHTFQPLLYQVATAGLEPDSIAGPLRKSLGNTQYIFRMVRVTGVDFDNKEVITKVGKLSYDYLVLANGSVTNYFGKADIRKRVLPLKRVIHALDMRSHILQLFEQAEMTKDPDKLQQMMNLVVVGGGPTGVEVSGALAELKSHVLPKDHPDLDFDQMRILLVEGTPRLLNGMSEKAGKKALEYLEKMGVEVKLNALVESYEKGVVKIGQEEIRSLTVIWAAGVQGRIIDGIPADKVMKSRVLVDEFNRVVGHPDVFAIGDVACMASDQLPNGHPMLAPVAIQQGVHLAKNFKLVFKGQDMRPFRYFDKGSMATIGRNKAVVDLPGGMHLSGFFAWLVWMFVHIMYLIGFRNRVITLANWLWSYFTYDKGTRLIIRTFAISARERMASDE